MDRIEPIVSNEPYHIYNRGNNRQRIFHEERDYLAFLKKLDAAAEKHAVSIVAYAVMPNHYHLLVIQRTGGSVPDMMGALGTSVAKRYNLKYGHIGHVFQGPYRYSFVATVEGVAEVARYIHLNPVRAKLVKLPEEWRFSSYRLLLESFLERGLSAEQGNLQHGHLRSLDPAPILAVFGGSVQRYIEFVQQGIAEEGFLLPGLDSDEGNLQL